MGSSWELLRPKIDAAASSGLESSRGDFQRERGIKMGRGGAGRERNDREWRGRPIKETERDLAFMDQKPGRSLCGLLLNKCTCLFLRGVIYSKMEC